MKQLFKFTALLMAVAMMVVACAAPETPANMAEDTVNVSFQFPEPKTTSVSSGSVDSVLISSVFFQYKAENVSGIKIGETLEWTNLTSDEVSGLGHTLKLGRGVWNVSLRGFATAAARTEAGTAETAGTKAIFNGELTSFSVGDGSTVLAVTADVPLEFTNNTGKGSCTVTVTFDEAYAGVANKKATVRLQSGEFDQTINLTFGENGTDASDAAEFTEVDNGIATITVDYLDSDGTPFGDTGSATTLIMTDMHTTTTATISMDVVKFTINGSKPEGSAEDNVIPKVFNSIFDIYPDNIADNEIVVGYAEETKALDQTPITYPYEICTAAEKDEKGRYTASSLGLIPIVVTNKEDLNTSGAAEAWWGKNAGVGLSYSSTTSLVSVKYVDDVTSITDNAFFHCHSLTSINIPDSVTSIGRNAFSDCKNLTSLTLPENLITIERMAFNQCDSLTSVVIPNSVVTIKDEAFSWSDRLVSVIIPDSVTTIGNEVFWECPNLTSVSIGKGVTSIGYDAFKQSNNLKEIKYGGTLEQWYNLGISFEGNTNYRLDIVCIDGEKAVYITNSKDNSFVGFTPYGKSIVTDFTIPENIKKVKYYATNGCNLLTSITIPDSVVEIENMALDGKSLLSINVGTNNSNYTSVDGILFSKNQDTIIRCPAGTTGSYLIPENVTSINTRAFQDCSGLTSITIPNSVTSIGDYAFYGCAGLTSITIPDSVTSIGDSAFWGCKGLTSITIPNSVTSIGSSVFSSCSGLTSITIPNSVTSIGSSAFSSCSGLTSITIPNSVTSIGSSAFATCNRLTSITIPNSVTSIGSSAFVYCDNLTDIYVNQAESDTLFANASVPSRCTIHWNSTGPESV